MSEQIMKARKAVAILQDSTPVDREKLQRQYEIMLEKNRKFAEKIGRTSTFNG